MSPSLAVAIAIAGGLGSLARYAVALSIGGGPGRFPWATLAVNVVGAAALGLVVALAAARPEAARWRAVVGVGFLGGFTTFSTYSPSRPSRSSSAAPSAWRWATSPPR
jgi:CrcB protein